MKEELEKTSLTTLIISKKLVILCLILLLAFSCSEKDPQPSISKASKTAPPKVTVLANLPDSSKPVRVLLKKPVRRIKAGRPIIRALLDSITHMVMKPEEQAKGFFTNYTTEDGLALETIYGSVVDKDGNLWFGTDGGGVSRYDGQTFTNYTVEHGLLSNLVFAVTQDRSGALWFGTVLGASRFDGRSFTNYTAEDGLAKGGICFIFEDISGELWFCTIGGGLSHFDGKKFHNLTTADGLADNNVRFIAEDKPGSLWIGTGKGLCHYDGKRFYTLPQFRNHFIECIAKDNQGNLWLGTEIGAFWYNAREFGSDSVTLKFPSKHIWWITKDRAGSLWMGTAGDGVIRYDGSAFTRFTTANGLPVNEVIYIGEDKTGNLWFGTGGGGIVRYGGKSVMNYTAAFGSTDDFSTSRMIEDKAGNLWFGTGGRGVSRYDGKSFSTYTTSQGLIDNRAWPLIQDKKGDLWIGTAKGVSRFDGEAFTSYTQGEGLSSHFIPCMVEAGNGKIWFGTADKGAICFDGNSFINYSEAQGLPGKHIVCITEDAKGCLWFGTPEGLSRFDGRSFIHYTTANGLPNNFIYCSATDSGGNLWVGTMGGGISRFDGTGFLNFTVAQGLPDNNIPAIVIDSAGKIIFGTNSGLAVLVQFKRYPATEKESLNKSAQNDLKNDDLKNYAPQFEIYNVNAGYPIKDLIANSMMQDSNGNLWMGTGELKNGLIRFDYSSVHKDNGPVVPVLHNVKINNEYVCWQDLLPQSLRKESGKAGLAPHITEEATTFGFILTGEARDSMRSKLKGIKFDSIRRFYPIPENLVLPYRHNNLSIDFGSVELNSPNLVKYQHILDGYDKEWSPIGNETSVTFGNLHEGRYIFKLRAQSPFGIWSDPIEYTFKVLPPWYRTWWAYNLYILIFLISLWAFVKWRTYAVKKENKALEEKVTERTKDLEQTMLEKFELGKKIESQEALLNERLRISRELHDDIGSTLGSISIYSEVAKKRNEKNENSNEVLSKIGLASRELIDKMSDIVWSLNPNNETFEQLQNRMMAFAAMMLAPQNIFYDLIVDEELKTILLTNEQRKNIFLIFKEALYNIVKYACCKNVHVLLSAHKNGLTMIIQDDGKGFDVNQATATELLSGGEYLGGNGINNMKARAHDMNAALYIDSKINEGTTVQLTLHL